MAIFLRFFVSVLVASIIVVGAVVGVGAVAAAHVRQKRRQHDSIRAVVPMQ